MEINGSDIWRGSRREILALSIGMMTAMSLGSIYSAQAGQAAGIRRSEENTGGKTKKNVLVAYAGKYGSTGEIAGAIGKELCACGLNADVASIENVRNIGTYQGVVVGSAIYMGKWMPEASDFVKRNRETLRHLPVSYFFACITLARPEEKKRAEAFSYMEPILKAAPEIQPVGIGSFAGKLDYNNLSGLTKMIMKAKGAPEGDFRDWKAISAWARQTGISTGRPKV